MANPQIDQFMHALMWKAVPPIILASIGAIFLREGLQWLERRATRFGRDWQRRRREESKTGRVDIATRLQQNETPQCPECTSPMVKRTAKRGARAGNWFWGCPKYPKCRGTRDG
jgi:restriction system protein